MMFWSAKRGKSDMKVVKTLVIIACSALLSAGGIGSARHAYAQDAAAIDAEGWSAGGTGSADLDSADQLNPEAQGTPLTIGGCWSGSVNDTGDGTGTASLTFAQNGKKIQNASRLNFDWPDQAFVHSGVIHGTVSSTGIKFNGNAGKGCSFHGKATGDASAMDGTVKFTGKCAKFFKNVTFSIGVGC
jgi:hypothetical protein